jgi:hypothetical protein
MRERADRSRLTVVDRAGAVRGRHSAVIATAAAGRTRDLTLVAFYRIAAGLPLLPPTPWPGAFAVWRDVRS